MKDGKDLTRMYDDYLENFEEIHANENPCDECIDFWSCREHCNERIEYEENNAPMSFKEFCDGYYDYISCDDDRY